MYKRYIIKKILIENFLMTFILKATPLAQSLDYKRRIFETDSKEVVQGIMLGKKANNVVDNLLWACKAEL